MSRPSDHYDSPPSTPAPKGEGANLPRLGFVGTARFLWRQLTSMRTALFLLLLLAIAAVPGSLFPQRGADPNGVTKYFADNPTAAEVLDKLQLFDVYTSAWFSAIYLLLFISLIGCVLPRTMHHLKALRSQPPRTPARLERLSAFAAFDLPASETDAEGRQYTAARVIESARSLLRRARYRARIVDGRDLSVSAERGYLRETGNLVFHAALLCVLIAVGIGGSIGYTGQKAIVVGQSFVNVRGDFDSFIPGRLFNDGFLQPYRLVVNSFEAKYEEENLNALGEAIDYTASLTSYGPDDPGTKRQIKVNHPLRYAGNEIYLLGNGYAPKVTVRNAGGKVVFTSNVLCLPQDNNLTSICTIKVPDGLKEQLGMVGFFYPTASPLDSGAFTSVHPDLGNPLLTLRVYAGDLGIDQGIPKSVYTLDPSDMTEIAGGTADAPALELKPGDTATLPGGFGSITFDNASPDAAANDLSQSVTRYVSLDVHSDPTQGWVLVFVLLAVLGLLTTLFVPRRRMWVKVIENEDGSLRLEYGGLARGEDPGLDAAVAQFARRHAQHLGLKLSP